MNEAISENTVHVEQPARERFYNTRGYGLTGWPCVVKVNTRPATDGGCVTERTRFTPTLRPSASGRDSFVDSVRTFESTRVGSLDLQPVICGK